MTKEHIKVKDHVGLVRDQKTQAILNINSNEIADAKLRKKLKKQKDKELRDMKNELGELREIVNKLIERN